MGKLIIDSLFVSPNPIDTGKELTVELILHEEYENAKKSPYKYPVRFGGKENH